MVAWAGLEPNSKGNDNADEAEKNVRIAFRKLDRITMDYGVSLRQMVNEAKRRR